MFDGRTGEEITDPYTKRKYLQFSIFEKYIYPNVEGAMKALNEVRN